MKNVKSKLKPRELVCESAVIDTEDGPLEVKYRLLSACGEGEYYLMEISTKEERELVCIGKEEMRARIFYSMCVKGQVTPCTLEACAENVRACVWEF